MVQCPVCSRKFATRAALAQHRLDKHQQAVAPAPKVGKKRPPRKVAAPINRQGKGRVVSGSDIIAIATIESPGNLGDLVVKIQINPRRFLDTRIYQESYLWARWRPKSLVLKIHPSAGQMSTGALLSGWCPDPMETLPLAALSSVRRLATFPVHQESRVSERSSLKIPCDPSRRWYTFDSIDPSDTEHGVFFIILSAPVPSTLGDVVVNVHLDWQIEFDGPDLPVRSVAGQTIYADPTLAPYRSNKLTGWCEGKKLTLTKATSGEEDEVVKFIGALHNKVYKIMRPGGRGIPAGSSAGPDAELYWGVIAKDYAQADIMALFDSSDDAFKYIARGLEAYQAEYVSPGETVNGNPPWNLHERPPDGAFVLDGPMRTRPMAPRVIPSEDDALTSSSSVCQTLDKMMKVLKIFEERLISVENKALPRASSSASVGFGEQTSPFGKG